MRKILAVFMALTLLLPAVCWAANEPAAGIINHVMATKIEYRQGQGYLITGPTNIQFNNPAGATSAVARFSTLDQLVFVSGTYKVSQNIIDDASGATIATAKYDHVPIQSDHVVESFVTNWNVPFKAGLYTYQVLVNDTVLASFKIVVENAQ
jgi:hypothetical protein